MSGLYRLVAESSDESLLAVASFFYRGSVLRIYNADADQPVFELIFPPDGRRGIFATYIGFNPDKSRFLLETNAPEIHEYETKTWKLVSDAALVPQEAIHYVPSLDWTRGIALSANGKAYVWDASAHRMIATLETSGQVQSASFSPRGDMLALTSGPGVGRPARLTLWDANSGHLLRELWPVRWGSMAQGAPLWWDNGRLIIAAIRGNIGPDNGIGVWDVSTGRFQGRLDACSAAPVVAEGNRLLQNCQLGEVLEWNAESVQKDIRGNADQIPR
jgi:WD40 repeat protein